MRLQHLGRKTTLVMAFGLVEGVEQPSQVGNSGIVCVAAVRIDCA